MARKNVGFGKVKELVKHLKSDSWAEVKFHNTNGFFDVTCLSHLKDLLFDYADNKISNIEDVNLL